MLIFLSLSEIQLRIYLYLMHNNLWWNLSCILSSFKVKIYFECWSKKWKNTTIYNISLSLTLIRWIIRMIGWKSCRAGMVIDSCTCSCCWRCSCSSSWWCWYCCWRWSTCRRYVIGICWCSTSNSSRFVCTSSTCFLVLFIFTWGTKTFFKRWHLIQLRREHTFVISLVVNVSILLWGSQSLSYFPGFFLLLLLLLRLLFSYTPFFSSSRWFCRCTHTRLKRTSPYINFLPMFFLLFSFFFLLLSFFLTHHTHAQIYLLSTCCDKHKNLLLFLLLLLLLLLIYIAWAIPPPFFFFSFPLIM